MGWNQPILEEVEIANKFIENDSKDWTIEQKQVIENINKDKNFNLDDVMMSYSENTPEKPDI